DEPVALECAVERRDGDGRRAEFQIGFYCSLERAAYTGFSVDPDPLSTLKQPQHFGSRDCSMADAPLPPLPELRADWEETLRRFARENHVGILSDAYDVLDTPEIRTLIPRQWLAGVTTAPEVLDRLCWAYGAQWNAAESPLLF